MNQDFSKQILEKTRADYHRIALLFSETRERSYDLEPLVRDVRSDESVLDVGCGNGRLLDVLPVGVRYTGCDTSEQMIALAKKRQVVQRPTIQFISGDILALPFASQSFDHVFTLSVLHHIPSEGLRQQAVAELARVVKPGGRVTITVWNLRNFYWMRRYQLWRLLFGLHPKGYDRGDCLLPWRRGVEKPILRYIHAWTYRELQRIFTNGGLGIIASSRGRNFTVVAEKK